jgi:cytidine deaminase
MGKQFEIITKILEYDSDVELESVDRNLLIQARNSTSNAYAPYSNFRVGAAVLLSNGVVVGGNNQENVAYPSGLCAERVAIYSAGALYPEASVVAVAVSCTSDKFEVNKPMSPCGACRQAMAEYEQRSGQPIRIILGAHTGPVQVIESVKSLLPLIFEAPELKD